VGGPFAKESHRIHKLTVPGAGRAVRGIVNTSAWRSHTEGKQDRAVQVARWIDFDIRAGGDGPVRRACAVRDVVAFSRIHFATHTILSADGRNSGGHMAPRLTSYLCADRLLDRRTSPRKVGVCCLSWSSPARQSIARCGEPEHARGTMVATYWYLLVYTGMPLVTGVSGASSWGLRPSVSGSADFWASRVDADWCVALPLCSKRLPPPHSRLFEACSFTDTSHNDSSAPGVFARNHIPSPVNISLRCTFG